MMAPVLFSQFSLIIGCNKQATVSEAT